MSLNIDKIKALESEIRQLNILLESKNEELRQLQESNEKINENLLTNSEISRFSRQIILPEIGVKGQIKLRNAKILIVGAGGLGINIETSWNLIQSINSVKFSSRMSIGVVFMWCWHR